MVGQRMMVTKPSRSDEVPDEEEQLKIANQVRAQFDSLAPRRPLKPNRSEPDRSSSSPVDSSGSFEHAIPELDKLRSLQSQSPQGLFAAGSGSTDVQGEFVETQYYKELESVDKQHHATGSGFISAIGEGRHNGSGYDVRYERDGFKSGPDGKPAVRSNPATNDWVPSDASRQDYVSTKPNRSESS
ncbi:uncharacterized protein LOC115742166 isoform X2 [Rhodamnia argentea]|uniref:Uncharacterized protein LOC115742166 isoform X2 n=1 Tax=Rhodamnia argentea TaxID=178133 RepID=A0A8B8PBI9_9MYRT|nr:uncharacterized protein LOC115742166 isoform X2 [Rhodamnia argentea]